MGKQLDLMQGTLDMLILKAVSLGPLHGYGILLRIGQISKDRLVIQQGSLYPALYRLEQQGWIASEWGESENNRRAKYYQLTASGKKRLKLETENWNRMADLIGEMAAGGGDLMMLRRWLKSMRNRGRVESDMNEELRFHIDSYASDLRKQGVSSDEALRRALVEFGGVEAKKEECRESLGLRLWDELQGDIRSAFRSLRQSPLFTVVAVVSLGMGIGANTAIFTLANKVLLKTMAVPESDRLRLFDWAKKPNARFGHAWGSFDRNEQGEMVGTSFPYPLYQEMRRSQNVMEDIAGFKDVYQLGATVDGEAEPVDGMLVSGNFYKALRVRIEAGRAITDDDDATGAAPVVVISDAYWSRRFARSADALGKTIELNRLPVTIVGVNAPEFAGPKAGGTPEVFFPLSLQPHVIPRQEGSLLTQNSFWWVLLIGRLKTGVTDEAATSALSTAFIQAFRDTLPERRETDRPRFEIKTGNRGLDMRTHEFTKPISLLLAAAGMVLLIACANLANLLLARAAVRRREISLRMAMGAGRGRIVRLVLTEALLLAFLGGAAGLLVGYAGRNFIPSLFADTWSKNLLDAQMDWRVFVFAAAITVVTGLLFGTGPAWRATRCDTNETLKETGRMTNGRSKALFGKSLVVFQVALSLLLVISAGLFLRTLINLRSAPTGMNTEHVILFQVKPPEARYSPAQRVALFQRITEGLTAMAGAQSVTSSSEPLLAESMDGDCFRPVGQPTKGTSVFNNSVGANFFSTFGIAVLSGRGLTLGDGPNAQKVAVVNQPLAKQFFPNENAVGQIIRRCDSEGPIQIVGVSAGAKYDRIRGDAPPTLYLPYAQSSELDAMTFEVKTAASLGSVAPRMRKVVQTIDKDLPVLDIRTQNEQIDATLTQERVFATLTSGFGLLALLLASIGIYGVMAYTVSRRTNEIGIRMALGAEAGGVLAMILRETSLLACAGILGGLAAALAATRVVASMLFGLKATDPATFAAAAALLLLIALTAALIPAWRAAKVDPMNALRHE